VEEANDRSLLSAAPYETLRHLVGLQVDQLLVLVPAQRQNAVVDHALLHRLLLNQRTRQDLLDSVVLPQTA
jgi:hypothetical protein